MFLSLRSLPFSEFGMCGIANRTHPMYHFWSFFLTLRIERWQFFWSGLSATVSCWSRFFSLFSSMIFNVGSIFFADVFCSRLSFGGKILEPSEKIISWSAHPPTDESQVTSHPPYGLSLITTDGGLCPKHLLYSNMGILLRR